MTHDDNDSPAPCFKRETKLISGVCPDCGQELEFFSVPELRNQGICYHCKKPFDVKAFAAKAGLSI
jgi:predicted amidophosphoribosyltransferase